MSIRPGFALLESLIREERRGRPGAAGRAARKAAERDPARAAEHLLDAVFASLVAGEPRAAGLLLDEVEQLDLDVEANLRVRSCRSWADHYDRNWYPGDTGAEHTAVGMLTLDSVSDADPETMLLEHCVAEGPPPLLSSRSLVESLARHRSPGLPPMLALGYSRLLQLGEFAIASGAVPVAAWALSAVADLHWRAGSTAESEPPLKSARIAYEELSDPIGLACTYLIEGDWHAVPGSSPEALGFDLAPQVHPSPVAWAKDDGKAAACYDRAAALLDGVDAPRALGALALRRAALCWAAEDFDGQRHLLAAADTAFAEAGDHAGRQVVAVHLLLAELASDKIATTRLAAGTGWDLQPRGPIAELVAWSTERGSVSFAAGLGRLLQRAAEHWAHRETLERASAAYSMALPLLRLGSPVLPATILDAMAEIDTRRQFFARALVRLEQATRILPPVAAVTDDPHAWQTQVNIMSSIARAEIRRATASTAGVGLGGLERAIARLRALAEADGVPSGGQTVNVLRDAEQMVEEISNSLMEYGIEDLMARATSTEVSIGSSEAVVLMAGLAHAMATTATIVAAIIHGQTAQRAGSIPEADGWFSHALELVDSGEPQYKLMGVFVCVAWGKDEVARSRFEDVQKSGLLGDKTLNSLGLLAGDPQTAVREMAAIVAGRDDVSPSWGELAERAEVALRAGSADEALSIASAALERFEAIIATFGRDPDRLALCDDINASGLHMLAAQACIAIAQERARLGDLEGSNANIARSFELSDRGHSLTLAILALSSSSAAPQDDAVLRHWQQAATEWSATFERLLAAYEAGDGENAEQTAIELTRSDDELVRIEADIESSRPGVISAARELPPAADMWSIVRSLPTGSCLLQYHVVGRGLAVWGLTSEGVKVRRRRLHVPGVAPLVGAYWRACSSHARGDEAEELADLLLDPVADFLRACDRVIVVPFGPLTAVPFHALPFEGAPLGHERVISFLPSASILAGRELDEPITRTTALAVGDPAFDPSLHPGLSRLPGAAVEARSVGRLWRTQDVLVGDDARASGLRELLPRNGVLHLAAHGHLDEFALSSSALVLAGTDRLTVADLIGLRLDAELAILSACDTGRGAATLGGDVIGLTRGLLAAGVQRAVVSLWPVDDIAACVTMAEFHARLRDTYVPARALAGAQRTIRTLSGSEILARYAALGGEVSADAPTVRRGGGTPLAARRRLELDPEFVDTGEPDAGSLEHLDGSLERVWAPFIIVGR